MIFGHLNAPKEECSLQFQNSDAAVGGRFRDSDDDVVIVSALRTPICKARRGGLKVGIGHVSTITFSSARPGHT